MNIRILSIAKKEILQLFRDRKTLPMILIVPVVQVILFGYVAATDVKNINFAVIDRDQTVASREIISKVENSGFFINQGQITEYPQLERMMDTGKIKIGLVIPAGFHRDIMKHSQPTLQVLIDGTDSNTASIARNYFINILDSYSQQLVAVRLRKIGVNLQTSEAIGLNPRVYFNPELRGVNYMVPAVTALVLLLITIMLTALSIVKEKELGTIEQIMVTPVKSWEFIMGKLLPYPLIGMLDVLLVVVVGSLWFSVPIKGNLILLFSSALLFLMTTLGMGLLISTMSNTQQQAMLSTIFFLIPNILLSGFIFPIANMPLIFQIITYIIPGRYFIEIIRGIYLKGIGLSYLYPQLIALAIIGTGILVYSVKSFRKQLV